MNGIGRALLNPLVGVPGTPQPADHDAIKDALKATHKSLKSKAS